MNYLILTENDISEWDDETGIRYHYPSNYKSRIQTGDKFIYYKGADKNNQFAHKRLTNNQHYFGTGEIGKIVKVPNTNNYYAYILNYEEFIEPVIFKEEGVYLEPSANEFYQKYNAGNYFRGNAVRTINEETYLNILNKSGGLKINSDRENIVTELTSATIYEGNKKLIYTTKYERSKSNREKAIRIHGCSCKCCCFNFEKTYGNIGKDFIHVHHIVPLHSLDEEIIINPETDLIPVCPNCHSMIHREKNKTLSIDELKIIINNI